MMRKFRLPLLLLLVLGAFFGWRAMHPKLTDEQQIAANLDAICQAAKNRNPRGIADFLAKDFQAGGVGKKEFRESLAAGILQFRVIDLQISSVKNVVQGESASSDGRFLLSLKSEVDSPLDPHGGGFKLKWRKIEGEWKIESADVPSLSQLSGGSGG